MDEKVDGLMSEKGIKLYVAKGSHEFLPANGIKPMPLHWPDEDLKPNVIDYIQNKHFDLVINIPKNLSAGEPVKDYLICRSTIDHNIPLITNSRLTSTFIKAFCTIYTKQISIKSWDEYQ